MGHAVIADCNAAALIRTGFEKNDFYYLKILAGINLAISCYIKLLYLECGQGFLIRYMLIYR